MFDGISASHLLGIGNNGMCSMVMLLKESAVLHADMRTDRVSACQGGDCHSSPLLLNTFNRATVANHYYSDFCPSEREQQRSLCVYECALFLLINTLFCELCLLQEFITTYLHNSLNASVYDVK